MEFENIKKIQDIKDFILEKGKSTFCSPSYIVSQDISFFSQIILIVKRIYFKVRMFNDKRSESKYIFAIMELSDNGDVKMLKKYFNKKDMLADFTKDGIIKLKQ
jgi:hypothetical protein